MKRRALLLYIILLSLLSFRGYGQGCNSILSKADLIIPDQFCSPVQVDREVTYVEAVDGWTNVEIRFDWDDGSSETVSATEGPAGSLQLMPITPILRKMISVIIIRLPPLLLMGMCANLPIRNRW